MTIEQALIAELCAKAEKLQAEIIRLKQRSGLNAENPSSPPSQRPVRKSKISPLGGRKGGGPPGHPDLYLKKWTPEKRGLNLN